MKFNNRSAIRTVWYSNVGYDDGSHSLLINASMAFGLCARMRTPYLSNLCQCVSMRVSVCECELFLSIALLLSACEYGRMSVCVCVYVEWETGCVRVCTHNRTEIY